MDNEFNDYDSLRLLNIYCDLTEILRKREILDKNLYTQSIAEYLAFDYFNANNELPNLKKVSIEGKNFNAMTQTNEKYNIQGTRSGQTGVFSYINVTQKVSENLLDELSFDSLILVKLSDYYRLEKIIKVSWESMLKQIEKHKKLFFWRIELTNSLVEDSEIIYDISLH